MAHRIEVVFQPNQVDALGEKTAGRIRHDLHLAVDHVRTAQVYTVDADLNADELRDLASGPYTDPIIQDYAIDKSAIDPSPFDWLIEVGFLPGVTDNVGRTAREAAQVRLGRTFDEGRSVHSSIQYWIKGDLSDEDVERVASELLANKLIQRWTIRPASQVDPAVGLPAVVPKVGTQDEPVVDSINLELKNDELIAMSREMTLALSLAEMKAIRNHYRDKKVQLKRASKGLPFDRPSDVELEVLAQTWSEHCKHKIFAAKIAYEYEGIVETIEGLFPTYIKALTAKVRKNKGRKDYCQSVFTDNAGVIKFNDDFSLVMKVETHNSPSALDPYGGALTGIVGVNRDPFGTGQGAKLCFNTDVFCFAPPDWDKPIPPRLLHPKRVFDGVREGVEHGGNKSGIPTVNGSIVFDDRFLGKPLVFCGTGGLLPAKVNGKSGWDKTIKPGDMAVMVGGRVGADGIHGATFSSEELREDSPATAVQIGDPITQKRMTDFLLIARDKGWYRFITDNGAGGLASSIGEMARECGGCEIYLDKVPLKYHGLRPWMILLSESQERMSLAIPPEHWEEFHSLAKRMDVEATVVGKFAETGDFDVFFGEKIIASLPMTFLHDGVPTMSLHAKWEPPQLAEPTLPATSDWTALLKRMLGRLNICSKEYVVRQYDHEVQGGSVVKPLVGAHHDGPSDAAVWRPILTSMEAVVVSHGLCPRYSDVDAYDMSANSVDEAVRNAVAVGADPDYLAGLDNFCWCDPVQSENTPDGEYKLAQLVRANKALFNTCVAYGIPCISGKDSMKNDYLMEGVKISVPPTMLFTVVGKLEDARKAVTMDAKSPGDLVYVVGLTRAELGASEYYAELGLEGPGTPEVHYDDNIELYRKLHEAIKNGLVRSCHDCSDGGLAIALAETAFAGDLGMRVDLSKVPTGADSAWRLSREQLAFSESAGRFVVTIRPESKAEFEKTIGRERLGCVGEVSGDKDFVLHDNTGEFCRVTIDELKAAWQATLDY
ncbi:MAG: phosphoribosylformylglycinamidine synthase [Deltaproteobacteria bacterium]|nr:phosphoribosylformylglycinamidine synthase [Deltaproteobacteria bacterium]